MRKAPTRRTRPTLQVVLPFSPPDARCLEHVRKTRAERIAALIQEIERENERIERDRARAIIDKTMESARI